MMGHHKYEITACPTEWIRVSTTGEPKSKSSGFPLNYRTKARRSNRSGEISK